MSSKCFPKDCEETCPYFRRWDLSVDDYTNACEKLRIQVDDMDAYSPFYIPFFCPLNEESEVEE